MTTHLTLGALALACCVTAHPSSAQTITAQVFCDFEHPVVWPTGIPALHDGTVAFLGYSHGDGSYGIWTAPLADPSAPLQVIRTGTTVMPNALGGSTFGVVGQPSIRSGTVGFTGAESAFIGYQQGIYTVPIGGGSVVTKLDAFPVASPKPGNATLGQDGFAFQLIPGFAEPPAFLYPDGTAEAISGNGFAAPGGGSHELFENLAYGPNSVLYSGYVDQPNGDGGLYEFVPSTGERLLVANGATPVPGESFNFDFFFEMDTDGEHIVFTGKGPGSIGFGAEGGVFVAQNGANGTGALTTIARAGDPAPGGGTLRWFGPVTIEGDLVLFTAITGHPAAGYPHSIFGCRIGGAPFRVFGAGDIVDGKEIIAGYLHWRGLDGGNLIIAGQHEDPGPLGYRDAIYHVTIQLDEPAHVDQTPGGAFSLTVGPNPLRESSVLSFAPRGSGSISLELFDSAGRRVRSLVHGATSSGIQSITWDGRDDRGVPVAAGAYFARLSQGSRVETTRITAVR